MSIDLAVREVTPEMAAKWLEGRAANRKIKPFTVAKYAQQMRRKKWQLNGEPIIVGEDGKVIDGQHRLSAVIESGVATRFVVVLNVENDCIETIDTGSARTPADILTMSGLNPSLSGAVATAAKMVISHDNAPTGFTEPTKQMQHLVTPQSIHLWVEQNPGLVQAAEWINGFPKRARPMPWAALTFLAFVFARIDEDEATIFVESLCTGAGMLPSDPCLELRNKLLAEQASHRKAPFKTQLHWAIRAFRWHLANKPVNYAGNLFRTNPELIASSFNWLKAEGQ